MGVVSAIGLAISAYGAVSTRKNQKESIKNQRRAIAAQQKQADLANARERRTAVRNARVMRASIESQAATTGLVGSSAAQGSMSNVQSRLGENLSFLDQNQQLSSQASLANEAAARYASKAATGQAITGFGQMIFQNSKTFSGAKPGGPG